jgi:hypothetical protein
VIFREHTNLYAKKIIDEHFFQNLSRRAKKLNVKNGFLGGAKNLF